MACIEIISVLKRIKKRVNYCSMLEENDEKISIHSYINHRTETGKVTYSCRNSEICCIGSGKGNQEHTEVIACVVFHVKWNYHSAVCKKLFKKCSITILTKLNVFINFNLLILHKTRCFIEVFCTNKD